MKGILWRHLKNLRKKVSLSRKQLLEAFEKNIYFLKSIRLKSHSAEKPKKRSFRPIKRFFTNRKLFKKCKGYPLMIFENFRKKSQSAEKTQRGDPLVSPAVLLEA